MDGDNQGVLPYHCGLLSAGPFQEDFFRMDGQKMDTFILAFSGQTLSKFITKVLNVSYARGLFSVRELIINRIMQHYGGIIFPFAETTYVVRLHVNFRFAA